MKATIKSFASAIALILVLSVGIAASERPKSEVVTIQTTAICGMCKKTIEKAVLATEGVEEAVLNLNTKKIKIKFDPAKTTANKLRTVIANTGYDADDVKKNEESFNKLPECCQRPMPGDKD